MQWRIYRIYKIAYKVKQSTWQTENGWLGSHSTFDQEKKIDRLQNVLWKDNQSKQSSLVAPSNHENTTYLCDYQAELKSILLGKQKSRTISVPMTFKPPDRQGCGEVQ